MNKIPTNEFKEELCSILAPTVGEDYADKLVDCDKFVADIKSDVEQASAWAENGEYNDTDICYAIGRTICGYLDIEV